MKIRSQSLRSAAAMMPVGFLALQHQLVARNARRLRELASGVDDAVRDAVDLFVKARRRVRVKDGIGAEVHQGKPLLRAKERDVRAGLAGEGNGATDCLL